MERSRLDIPRDIFNKLLEGKTSRKGIAIPDCRGKETMVVTRYGGDVLLTFYDNKTKKQKFVFVLEMMHDRKWYWNMIFRRFAQIKAKLKQR